MSGFIRVYEPSDALVRNGLTLSVAFGFFWVFAADDLVVDDFGGISGCKWTDESMKRKWRL